MAGLLNKILKKSKPEKETEAPKKPSSVAVGKKRSDSAGRRQKRESNRVKPVARLANAEVYRFIKSAHITEKAGALTEQNKYVFRIYPRSNKSEVKKSVEALYGVKVKKVHIVHSAPKKMRLGRKEGFKQGLKKGFKKAIVTLREGDKIELSPR